MRRIAVCLFAVCAVGLFAANVSAQEINACVKDDNGQLRIVEGPEDCLPSEYHMTWNMAGPEGPQGEQGDPGPRGLNGFNGAPGLAGPAGAAGATGTPGQDGTDGASAEPQYVFVGFSSEVFFGSAGLAAFNNVCVEDFGPKSKFCTTKDIMATIGWPEDIIGQSGWVHPTYVGSSTEINISGFGTAAGGNLSCNGWSDPTTAGLMLTEEGTFTALSCGSRTGVACCLPFED